jgi:hypothetical protein
MDINLNNVAPKDVADAHYANTTNAHDLDLKADITYVDNEISAAVVGLLDDRGNHDASTNLFPSTGGSGTAGAILKGDLWTVSVDGTLGGTAVTVGDVVRAKTDSPGQTSTNWVVTENNIGYVPENNNNKTTVITGNETSTILFPNIKAVVDWVTSLYQLIITATTWGSFINNLTSKTTPINADHIVLMDSANSNIAKKLSWSNLKDALNYPEVIYKSTTDSSAVTGVTVLTILQAMSIPPNTFSVGDIVTFVARTRKSGDNNTASNRFYISPSDTSLGSATLVGTFSMPTTTDSVTMGREAAIKTITNTEFDNSGTSIVGRDNSSTSAVTAANIDWTVQQYFVVAVVPASASDTFHFSMGYIIKN